MALVRGSAPDRSLVALAVFAAVEGVALLVYAVYDTIEAIRIGATGPADVSNGPAIILQILIFVIFGGGLLLVARGWWASKRWARAPFILAQVIALVVGIPLAGASGTMERSAGIAVTAIAVVGIVLALTPAVTRAIESPSD